MNKQIFRLILLVAILALSIPVFAQSEVYQTGGGTAITADNAGDVELLARFGRGTVLELGWSPDGASLFAAGSAGVWVYDTADLEAEPTEFTGHIEQIESLAISPDGSKFASGDRDSVLIVRETAAGDKVFESDLGFSYVYSAAFSPDNSLIAVGIGSDIQILNADSGAVEVGPIAVGRTVNSMVFSPDGASLITGVDDNTIRIWDVSDATEIAVLEGHTSGVRGVSISPDGSTIASVSADRFIRLWDVADAAETFVSEQQDGWVQAVSFSPDGTNVATGDDRGNLKVWDTSGDPVWVIETTDSTGILYLAYSPDGSTIAAALADRTIRLFDSASGAENSVITGHTSDVGGVAFSPDGAKIGAGYSDDLARLWDAASGVEDWALEGYSFSSTNQTSLAFTPDGEIFASMDGFGVFLRNAGPGGQISYLDTDGLAQTFTISPDSSLIATGDWNGFLELWNAKTGAKIASIQAHTTTVNSIAFSPDGSTIVTGSEDGTVRLWGIPG